MKNITKEFLEEFRKDEEYEQMAAITNKGTQIFEVDNVQDILKNYEEISKGQHDPNWIDLNPQLRTNSLLFEIYHRFCDYFHREIYPRAKAYQTDLSFMSLREEYNNFFRINPPKNDKVLTPNLIFLRDVFLESASKISLEGLPSFQGSSFQISDFSGKIKLVSSFMDLLWQGPSMRDIYFLNTMYGEEFDQNNLKFNKKYNLVAQALPTNYLSKGKVVEGKPLLRLFDSQIEEDDRKGKKDTKTPTPVKDLILT